MIKLDDYITGQFDPNAPFNQSDDEFCHCCNEEEATETAEHNHFGTVRVCSKCMNEIQLKIDAETEHYPYMYEFENVKDYSL